MSLRNSVIWSDGLFIKPHHFQQQQRYHDYVARRHGDAASAYQYGLESLELNKENLLHGRISIVSASGIFPDRTVFDIPGECPPPAPLDLSTINSVNETVYLALPLWANGLSEVAANSSGQPWPGASRARTVETRWTRPGCCSTSHSAGTLTLPTSATRPRSLRTRSTIITFSARSFSLCCKSFAANKSASGRAVRPRVPLIGRASTTPSRRLKKRSGEALTI